jgi:hypothetical protein
MADKAIALSEILARGVAIEWHEGVAMVRGLTAHLLQTADSEPPFPDLTQIDISPDGGVVVVGGRKSPEPVRRLGQLLQAVLGHGEPPVQLRLFITQATSPTPGFDSILAFDEALGYYERPNRDAVLRRLYERASGAPPVAVTPETTVDDLAPLPQPERPAKKAAKPAITKRSRRSLGIAAAVVVLVVVAVGAFEIAKATGKLQTVPSTASVVRSASTKLGDTVMSGVSAVTDAIGLGRLVPADAPAGAPPASVAPDVKKPTRVRKGEVPPSEELSATKPTVPSPDAAVQPTPNHATEPRFTAYDLDVPSPADSRAAKPIDLRGNAATPTGQVSITEVSNRVFSADSPDVVPPVGVRPKLSRQLPTNRSLDQLAPVEILVGLDGSVESVKFLRTPRDVRESMLLSAIKAWRFQPASKDGMPVKYQKTVWVGPE